MTNQRREFIKQLVTRAKIQAPDRFPANDPHLVDLWVERIPLEIFPPHLWWEALDHCVDHVEGELIKPKHFMKSAYAIRDRWEAQPEKREVLNRMRQARLDARVKRGELPAGTTPANAIESSSNHDPRTSEQIRKEFWATIRQKRAEREADKDTQNSTPTQALDALQNLVNKHTKGGDANA